MTVSNYHPSSASGETLKEQLKTSCFHCSEDCNTTAIVFDHKPFCCEGCQAVYQILQTHNMGQFYQIEQQAGTRLQQQKKEDYTWLNNDSIVERLLDFQNDKIAKVTFQLPQIHCASCVWLLENLYRLNTHILASTVNFLKREVYLTFEWPHFSLQQLVNLLASIGYAPAIDLSNLEQPKTSSSKNKKYSYQLGVAGFAFGNIMLMSFPEYLGLTDPSFQRWFGVINICLSIPVIGYSGWNYFRSAWFGLRHKTLNIDFPIALGMLTLFGRSVFEILTQTGAGYLDSLAGLVFFLLIGKWFQQRTYNRLSFERDYRSYFPISATLLKKEAASSVTLDQLLVGDRVLVRHEELIPADGILLKGDACIDYSFVTGESKSIHKSIGDKLFAGGRQIGSPIEMELRKKVSQSYLTQLWNDPTFSKKRESHTSQLANKVGRYFTVAILVVAFTTLCYWLPKDLNMAINAFTATLIIACPCAVALSVPFTLGNVIRLCTRQSFFVKNTQVIENLAKVDTIVFDKTGTITDSKKSTFLFKGLPLSTNEKAMVASLANGSIHPVSQGIFKSLQTTTLLPIVDFKEAVGIGTAGWIQETFVELTKAKRGTALKLNGIKRGVFIQENQWRDGLADMIQKWKETHQLFLLTGDNAQDKERLSAFFPSENLHFHQSPQDKLDFIKKRQANGHNVLMIGDGLNDAGALQQSDVGIVITEDTSNFTPASDAILKAVHFSEIPFFQRFSKSGIRVVYAAYTLALIYNIIGLSFAVQGQLSPVVAAILMPLSSITIAAFGITASSLIWRWKHKSG